MCVLWIPKGHHSAECGFLPLFADKIRIHKYEICIMFELVPDISITLGQICIFKTSVIAVMPVYKFQAVFTLQSVYYTEYAHTCPRVCVRTLDEKMSRIQ